MLISSRKENWKQSYYFTIILQKNKKEFTNWKGRRKMENIHLRGGEIKLMIFHFRETFSRLVAQSWHSNIDLILVQKKRTRNFTKHNFHSHEQAKSFEQCKWLPNFCDNTFQPTPRHNFHAKSRIEWLSDGRRNLKHMKKKTQKPEKIALSNNH